MNDKFITIKGARQHNLQNIDVRIPRDKLVVFTGLSGSGKSSLAFDTIYAEGQRRYVESLSSYARQFLGQMDKPDVDYIEGLSPAISIDQKTTSRNPRSTVGTVTEIYDYLRLLYARIGEAFCPNCGKPIRQQSIEQMADAVLALGNGQKLMILAPVIDGRKGMHQKVLSHLVKEGYVRVRVDGDIYLLSDDIPMDKNKKHTIEVVVDRIVVKEDIVTRLTDSLETAARLGEGVVRVLRMDTGEVMTFSQHFSCPDCHISLPEIEPRLFSFNSPYGACPACAGIGSTMEVDPDLCLPDPSVSFAEGAVMALSNNPHAWFMRQLEGLLRLYGFTLDNCFADLPKQLQEALMWGTEELCTFEYENMRGEIKTYTTKFEGIVPMVRRRYREASSDTMRDEFEQYMTIKPCTTCGGARLRKEVLAIKVGGIDIHELTDKTVTEMIAFFDQLELTHKQQLIGEQILKEIKARLEFLQTVGLNYLTLSRTAGTLSGGEAQRIRLATQIGSGLVGVLYILDEPSIGLHQRDNEQLLAALEHLRDLGNTLIVVEHDEDTMRAADYILDIGPAAGEHGGRIVAQGTVADIMACPQSLTGQYLKGTRFIPLPLQRREGNGTYVEVVGAREHNLKNIDVKFPIGTLTVVTGVSGSGKSTLVNEILYKGLADVIYRTPHRPGLFKTIKGTEYIDKIIDIDQSPIGRTPRSNPATYTGVFDFIRQLYSQTAEAKIRGYKSGRFSFNVKGGRCEACRGDGIIKIEMNFLPDVYVPCEVCHGARYNRETLEVKYKGKSIADVLDMTVDEAVRFFENIPRIHRKLHTLLVVGLGYIRLGQPATTLSGGEAQRVKLATELSKRSTGRTLYILDEPTTGLHTADIHKLMDVLEQLVAGGDTVVVIEHNLDVIKMADYIIDLGPEGGDGGGTVVASGTPEEICRVESSYTGKFLRPVLERTRQLMQQEDTHECQ
jgi:excinuclease ABC subunit A